MSIEIKKLFDAELYFPGTREMWSGPNAIVVSGPKTIVISNRVPPNEPACQLAVIRGARRSVMMRPTRGFLTDVWVDEDGTWIAGAYEGRLFSSVDEGESWEPFGRVRKCGCVLSVVRFRGDLWVAGDVEQHKSPGLENRGMLARRVGKSWRAVEVPGTVGNQRLERLVVVDDELYALG